MDLVYTLGRPSAWQHNELKYSIRSVEKHGDKFEKVFIIGDFPFFIDTKKANWIPAKDDHKFATRNIYEKLLKACDDERVSDNFFYVHDDHFFLKTFSLSKYPNYYFGTLEEYIAGRNKFAHVTKAAMNTLNVLKEKNFPTICYNVHQPCIINKKKFKKIMSGYDWNIADGYLIKSLYLNSLQVEGTPIADCTIKPGLKLPQIKQIIDGKPMFSTSNDAVTQDMRDMLGKMFPDKSRVEI